MIDVVNRPIEKVFEYKTRGTQLKEVVDYIKDTYS